MSDPTKDTTVTQADRETWLGCLQEDIKKAIVLAPDETCRTLARNLWDQTADVFWDE